MVSCPFKDCDFKSDNQFKVQHHAEIIHKRQVLPCVSCDGKLFINIRDHLMDIHLSDRKCHFCGNEFASYGTMNDHIRKFHKLETGLYRSSSTMAATDRTCSVMEKMKQLLLTPLDNFLVLDQGEFIILFDPIKMRPVLVFEWLCHWLYNEQDAETFERPDFFSHDERLPFLQVNEFGFKWRSSTCVGHLAACFNYCYSKEAFDKTFIISNASPMYSVFNSGVFNALEQFTRRVVNCSTSVCIFTIPHYKKDEDEKNKTEVEGLILPDVPEAYNKLLYINKPNESMTSQGYTLKHENERMEFKFFKSKKTVEEIETRTKLTFKKVSTTWDANRGKNSFICKFTGCYETFSRSEDCQLHESTHKPEFVCPKCNKKLSNDEEVKTCMANHVVFQCRFCDQRFTYNSEMENHEMSHTGERPYACQHDNCGKSFLTPGNLKDHLASHKDEKPYACDFPGCKKRYKDFSTLYQHKITHDKTKWKRCGMCNYETAYSSHISRHYRNSHGGEPPKPKPRKRKFDLTLNKNVIQSTDTKKVRHSGRKKFQMSNFKQANATCNPNTA